MKVTFFDLNVGDEFFADGDAYVKETEEDGRRVGDGMLLPFLPDDEVEDDL